MFLVGLTGSIATGKSTVSRMLKDQGCAIIDADIIAKEVVEPRTSGWKQVKAAFGDDILTAEGHIDRAKLAHIIFTDEQQRKLLNSIVHPLVRKEMICQALKCLFKGYRYVILDVPLLLDNRKTLRWISEVVVVYCSESTQLKRLMQRNNLTLEEAQQRINSQISIEEKRTMVTNQACLINNEGSLGETESQVDVLKQYLDKSRRPLVFRLCALAFSTLTLYSLAMWAQRLIASSIKW